MAPREKQILGSTDSPETLSPPLGLDREQHSAAQKVYAEKYDKLVKPELTLAADFARMSVEYGKTTVSYLLLGNSGGLGALVAVYPLVRESNQLWLAQQIPVAIAFAAGLFFAASSGAVAYYNFTRNATARWALATNTDLWIKKTDFQLDATKVDPLLRHNEAVFKRAIRQADLAYRAALSFALVSALAWAAGAVLLTIGVSRI
jgi:hypothetical protein